MKKIWIIVSVVIVAIIVFLFQWGVEIGNVRIGKQLDLKTPQSANFQQSVFFKEYYNSDKLTVVNLWATWCKPCIEEMPMLNKIKDKFQDRVNFVSFSVDTDSVKLVKFLKSDRFNFYDLTLTDLQYRNAIFNTLENRPADKWISSYSVPVTYLVKDNKVLDKIEGSLENDELQELIITLNK